MIVADASSLVDLLLRTPRGDAVAEALATEQELHVPELLDLEVLAAVRRWLARGWIDIAQADRALRRLDELLLVRHRHAPLRGRIWGLRDRCSSYDACYVALAEALDASLLTTDDRLGRAAHGLVAVLTPR